VDTKKVKFIIIFGDVQHRKETVRLVLEEGRRVSEVARELGISEGLLSRWKIKYEEGKEDPFPGNGRMEKFLQLFWKLKC
jgi:transposase-like protein